MMMELPKDIITGLTSILSTSIINDDTFVQILDAAISYVYENPYEIKYVTKTLKSEPILLKKVFAVVVCFFMECARNDLDEESLSNFLHVLCTNKERTKKLCDVYINNKIAIQSQLELIGNGSPHIIDVDWHLDYCIKLDTCNSVGVPLYHIQFSAIEHETIRHVKFSCTIQQLQELVFKLKDATRYSERLTNV